MQYARRVEGRDIQDDHPFSTHEFHWYAHTIRDRVHRGEELPAECCMLFVKPGRQSKYARAAAGTTPGSIGRSGTWWGTYVFDGVACFVIEENNVVTIIVPTVEQLEMLDLLLERSKDQLVASSVRPVSDRSEDNADGSRDALHVARGINRNLSKYFDAPPKAGSIEVFLPSNEHVTNQEPSVELLAIALRWINRAHPTTNRPLQLSVARQFRTLADRIVQTYPAKFKVAYLPGALRMDERNPFSYYHPQFNEACVKITTIPNPCKHTFVLITRKMLERTLGVIRHTIATVDTNPESWSSGTVLRINLDEPSLAKRADRFVLQ
ncbi:MAG TPA: hypothetical protein VN397_02900 [Candidatus Methylomirabilis sp.]|nr:hypothetical protein [Candidatus Methylomirabilis sp.]